MGTALHLQALLHAVASSHAVVDRWERHVKRRPVRLQLSGAACAFQGTGSATQQAADLRQASWLGFSLSLRALVAFVAPEAL